MSLNKPIAESCIQNRAPILSIIKPLFANSRAVLEVGSGTGQHAVFFARALSHLIWHTSDVSENHPGIDLWLEEANLANTRPPIVFDVSQNNWPTIEVDAIFSANTVHIMSWQEVELFFHGVGQLLQTDGLFCLYGPFNYNGQFTRNSNAQFDQWLKQKNPKSGIRDAEALNRLADASNMTLQDDYEMPANNRILCWKKGG